MTAASFRRELEQRRERRGQVRGTYTLEPGEADLIDAYQNHIESCRAWGRAQRAALGL